MKSTDQRRLFGTIIGASAATGDIATIPATQGTAGDGTASIALAFPPETFIARAAGGEPPRGADMNGFLNLLSSAVQVLQAGYLGPFDATFAAGIGGYPAGAVVSGSTAGTFWVSTADANTTVPGATGANWKSLFDGLATSAQLSAETNRAAASESSLSTSISTVAQNLNAEAQTRLQQDALKANKIGGNALTGNQTLSGGGTFRVGSTLDGSSMFIGMDGTNAGQAILVVENASGAITNVLRLDGTGCSIQAGSTFRVASTLDGSSMFMGMDGTNAGQAILVVEDARGAITNVLRLDGSDLSVNPGANVKVTSKVDGSYCRFTMDGSTGTMADLILVNPSGAIANVLRLQSDGYASVNAGRLLVLSDRFPVQLQNSVSNASTITTSLTFTPARSGHLILNLGARNSGYSTYKNYSLSGSGFTSLSESNHWGGSGLWIGNFLLDFTGGTTVTINLTINWNNSASSLSLSGVGMVHYDE